MPNQVSMGALMRCSFGAAPAALVVQPKNKVMCEGPPAATIMDHISMVNITPFGLCSSLANPSVASATAAAQGALTPMPCVPATNTPWASGAPTVQIAHIPALDNISTCMCSWGGVIGFVTPGTARTMIP